MHIFSNGRCPGRGKPAPCLKPMPELSRSGYPFLMGFKSILAFRVGLPVGQFALTLPTFGRPKVGRSAGLASA